STLGRGDILSDRGRIVLNNQQLLSNFRPAVTNHDYGLDALFIFPGGEIWFSVEEGFTDARLGTVQEGDLLSSYGYRVFRNQALLAAFAPADESLDYGLDAVWVVTDTRPFRAAPRILSQQRSSATTRFEWDGQGDVYQVECAPSLTGPWDACSE